MLLDGVSLVCLHPSRIIQTFVWESIASLHEGWVELVEVSRRSSGKWYQSENIFTYLFSSENGDTDQKCAHVFYFVHVKIIYFRQPC